MKPALRRVLAPLVLHMRASYDPSTHAGRIPGVYSRYESDRRQDVGAAVAPRWAMGLSPDCVAPQEVSACYDLCTLQKPRGSARWCGTLDIYRCNLRTGSARLSCNILQLPQWVAGGMPGQPCPDVTFSPAKYLPVHRHLAP